MNSAMLKRLDECKTESEVEIVLGLFGEDVSKKYVEDFMKMDRWKRTLKIYDVECEERNVRNALK